MKTTKVRFHTWYWGNYCTAPAGIELPEGFELYDEEKHGWKNSEEHKAGKKQMPEERECRLEGVVHKEYIVNEQKRRKNK